MTWLLYPLAVAAGLAAPVQFAVNSQLRNAVGGPVTAAAISFVVGSIVLAIAAAPTLGRIHGDRVAAAPWWVWTGGLLGAAYVVSSIVLTPRLGAGTTVVLFIAGNLIGAMLLDQFGLLRLPCTTRAGRASSARRSSSPARVSSSVTDGGARPRAAAPAHGPARRRRLGRDGRAVRGRGAGLALADLPRPRPPLRARDRGRARAGLRDAVRGGARRPARLADRGQRPPAEPARTLPGDETRIAFASCRVAAPHAPPYTHSPDDHDLGHGVDALQAYAHRMIGFSPRELARTCCIPRRPGLRRRARAGDAGVDPLRGATRPAARRPRSRTSTSTLLYREAWSDRSSAGCSPRCPAR